MPETLEPNVDRSCPACSSTKSRLCRSEIGPVPIGPVPIGPVPRAPRSATLGGVCQLDLCRDRDRLRHAEQHVRGRGDATLHVARAAALVGGPERDDGPGDADSGDRCPREHDGDARDQPDDLAGAEEGDAEAGEAEVADAPQERRGGEAAGDRADSLERGEDPDERRPAVQSLGRDREDQRLAEPGDGERRADADRQLAEDAVPRDVADAGRDLAQEVVLLGRARGLRERQADERERGDDERAGVHERDRVTSGRGEEAGAGERSDEAEALADRLVRAVRLGEELVGEHRLQHCGARRREDVAEETVETRDEIEEPDVAAIVHEEKKAHHAGEGELRADHQRPLHDSVDEEAAERRGEAREREHEEDEPRGAVRPGELLRPDREREEHHPVAEHRDGLAGEELPDVPACEQGSHDGWARNTRKSPLTVLPRTTSDGPSPSVACGSSPSGISDVRSPETEPASTSSFVPASTPTSMSPETLCAVRLPSRTDSTRTSPETVFV